MIQEHIFYPATGMIEFSLTETESRLLVAFHPLIIKAEVLSIEIVGKEVKLIKISMILRMKEQEFHLLVYLTNIY